MTSRMTAHPTGSGKLGGMAFEMVGVVGIGMMSAVIAEVFAPAPLLDQLVTAGLDPFSRA
ncbi:hypothetical protein GCM10009560_55780 [Nonomuraea longicatena]|uniref:Uncharacterized protein n=1 Tax=Nonomuraea longicatena TaxID=83682 RepID=A0ABN1QHU2_9ACTN